MIYESELYHHGIKGQKWGKRNGPPYPLDSGSGKKKYGMSKRQVKRAVNKSQKKYRDENAPQQGKMWASVGENWDKVKTEHEKANEEAQPYFEKRGTAEVKALEAETREDNAAVEKYDKEWAKWNNKITEIYSKHAKEYSEKYAEALLKDIGYKDIELGKKMLEDYNIKKQYAKATPFYA